MNPYEPPATDEPHHKPEREERRPLVQLLWLAVFAGTAAHALSRAVATQSIAFCVFAGICAWQAVCRAVWLYQDLRKQKTRRAGRAPVKHIPRG